MKRSPTTFSLLLGLLVLALGLGLGLAATLSLSAGRKVTGLTYGRLVAAAATAADELSARHDPRSSQTLQELRTLGIRTNVASAPPTANRHMSPMVEDVGQIAGQWLGDPSRVVVARTSGTALRSSESQIWIRSLSDPGRWIVLHALNYRREVIAFTLLSALIAGIIALALAALAARWLTRPLEGLAAHANELLGGKPLAETLHGSPREVHYLADAIASAGARLRAVARERELMLAGISHDLRTPLARLRLALELGDANDDERRQAMVADLEQLDSALEQCLAFVRDGSEEGLRETDIITVLGQLLALREHPEDWQFQGPAVLPIRVRPTLLRRALGNLMDNAERHGAAPFELSIGCDDDGVFVRVADHGPGVHPDLLQRLGQPFQRGDRARSTAGTGLGLSIARRASELHGGSLQLSVPPEGGFVALLLLPA